MYPNLIKVFYSNMDISARNQNQVIIDVAMDLTEFDVVDLNLVLKTRDNGLEIYTSRKELQFS